MNKKNKTIRREYNNIYYMGRLQTFTYFATQENPFGEDLHLYNGDPDLLGNKATLTRNTLEELIKKL